MMYNGVPAVASHNNMPSLKKFGNYSKPTPIHPIGIDPCVSNTMVATRTGPKQAIDGVANMNQGTGPPGRVGRREIEAIHHPYLKSQYKKNGTSKPPQPDMVASGSVNVKMEPQVLEKPPGNHDVNIPSGKENENVSCNAIVSSSDPNTHYGRGSYVTNTKIPYVDQGGYVQNQGGYLQNQPGYVQNQQVFQGNPNGIGGGVVPNQVIQGSPNGIEGGVVPNQVFQGSPNGNYDDLTGEDLLGMYSPELDPNMQGGHGGHGYHSRQQTDEEIENKTQAEVSVDDEGVHQESSNYVAYCNYLQRSGYGDDDERRASEVRSVTRSVGWKEYKLLNKSDLEYDSTFAKLILSELGLYPMKKDLVLIKANWTRIKRDVKDGMSQARSSATQKLQKSFFGKNTLLFMAKYEWELNLLCLFNRIAQKRGTANSRSNGNGTKQSKGF